MITRIVLAAVVVLFVSRIAFAQYGYGGGSRSTQPPPMRPPNEPSQKETTKTQSPSGVRGYIDSQMASSTDKKLHVTLGGKDLALTLIKIHDERASKLGGGKSSTPVDMKGADGKTYEIDFITSGGQVTNASVHKVNGRPL
jgi:hypothetical protein